MAEGPHGVRPGSARGAYRGSRKRLRRITLQKNTPVELWILLVLLLVMFLVIVPWIVRHPPPPTH